MVDFKPSIVLKTLSVPANLISIANNDELWQKFTNKITFLFWRKTMVCYDIDPALSVDEIRTKLREAMRVQVLN